MRIFYKNTSLNINLITYITVLGYVPNCINYSAQIKRTPGAPTLPPSPSRKMCEGGPPGVLFI